MISGANDVIVIRQFGGTLASSDWMVQMGKKDSLFESREGKQATIVVNNITASVKYVTIILIILLTTSNIQDGGVRVWSVGLHQE